MEGVIINNLYVGIDVGGTKIAYGIFDSHRKLLCKFKFPASHDLTGDQLIDEMAGRIRSAFSENGLSISHLTGIGVGLPGSVDYDQALSLIAANLHNMDNVSLRKGFGRHFDAQVLADNDAHCAALAEHRYGAGRGFKDMIYSTVSTGIGAGLIMNGKILRGSYNCAGLMGHMICTPGQGLTCGCGIQGDFESYTGGANIYKHVEWRVSQGETTIMTKLAAERGTKVTGEVLYDAFQAGDQMAKEVLDMIGKYLGILYFNLYQLLNINCYVLGGGLTHFEDALFDRIKESFFSYPTQCPPNYPVTFKKAELEQDFGIIGAAELFFE